MNEQAGLKEESLHIMREVEESPHLNQRALSEKLNISLGKINYLLKELIKKGIVKVISFSTTPEKARKVKYVLTKKGLEEKALLTFYFLKAKEREYKILKEEYEKTRAIMKSADI